MTHTNSADHGDSSTPEKSKVGETMEATAVQRQQEVVMNMLCRLSQVTLENWGSHPNVTRLLTIYRSPSQSPDLDSAIADAELLLAISGTSGTSSLESTMKARSKSKKKRR